MDHPALARYTTFSLSAHRMQRTRLNWLPIMLLFAMPYLSDASAAAASRSSAGAAQAAVSPGIRSAAAIVADLSTGQVLYSREADQSRPVASLTKLMAALVLVEAGLDLDADQTITKADHRLVKRGAPSRLRSGCAYTHRDLLHAALMVSDNVATVALGRSMGWTPEEFARRMTLRAAAMNLNHTRFADPTGLDENDVSTAREMLVILRAVLANPILQSTCQKELYVVIPVGGKGRPIAYRHTDSYIRRHPWDVLGAKTGYTHPAQYCLAIGAALDGRPIGMVFLGAVGDLTRFGDYSRTMRWLTRQPGLSPAESQTERG